MVGHFRTECGARQLLVAILWSAWIAAVNCCKIERTMQIITFSLHAEHNLTYDCTEAHSHSTVHQTGRFYCLIPAVCSLHHRCSSLQSCRLYWRDCVGHLWEYQDHRSQWLGRTIVEWVTAHVQNIKCTRRMRLILWLGTNKEAYIWVSIYCYLFHTDCPSTPNHRYKFQELCRSLHLGMD